MLALLVGSSIGYKAYTYSSVEALDKSKSEQENVISSSNVTENNLIKLSKLEHNPPRAKQIKTYKPKVKKCIAESKNLIERFMVLQSVPGLSIGISHKGNTLWAKGFGFANLEQGSKCHERTVMRIASISKPLTMLLVAKLVEEGKLDLDKPISHYLKEKFPAKKWQGKPVDITLRQLTSHLGGIRHYKEKSEQESDSSSPEFYIREKCKDVFQSIEIFKDDDLVAEPGTKYLYTTFGWVLVSAVVQCVLEEGETFENYLVDTILKNHLGMLNTYIDVNETLIANRACYYYKTKNGVLMNAPFVDNSHKVAGGGIVSNVPDILKFGNVMLYSYLGGKNDPIYGNLKGYLKQETVKAMWQPVSVTAGCSRFLNPGMGWFVIRPDSLNIECASCHEPPLNNVACHSGAAVGASSVLLILPEEEIVAAIICNLQNVSLYNLAIDVIKVFLKELKPRDQ